MSKQIFNNCKVVPSNQIFGILNSEEKIKIETNILKCVQKESFSRPRDKCQKALQCFINGNGILKVKTRILMREDTSRFRYRIVLPYDHPEVKKFIRTRQLNLKLVGI